MTEKRIRSGPEPKTPPSPPGSEVPTTAKGNYPAPPSRERGTEHVKGGPLHQPDYSCVLIMLVLLSCLTVLILMSLV